MTDESHPNPTANFRTLIKHLDTELDTIADMLKETYADIDRRIDQARDEIDRQLQPTTKKDPRP